MPRSTKSLDKNLVSTSSSNTSSFAEYLWTGRNADLSSIEMYRCCCNRRRGWLLFTDCKKADRLLGREGTRISQSPWGIVPVLPLNFETSNWLETFLQRFFAGHGHVDAKFCSLTYKGITVLIEHPALQTGHTFLSVGLPESTISWTPIPNVLNGLRRWDKLDSSEWLPPRGGVNTSHL